MPIPGVLTPDEPNLITFIIDDDSGVEVPGLGTAWSIEISIAGGSFNAASGTKGEIGYGWYSYITTAGEVSSAVTGSRVFRITHALARQQNLEYTVEPRVTGAVEVDYTVEDSLTSLGLAGVRVWLTASAGNSTSPLWLGYTNFAGLLKDPQGNPPRLPVGTLYVWKHHPGYIDDDNPDVIDTSTGTVFTGTMTAVPDALPAEDYSPVLPEYVYATPDDFQKYWFWDFGDDHLYEQLWPVLRLGGSRITVALAASDQLSCSRAGWAEEFLRELNCIIAGVMFNSPAVRLSNDQRQLYSQYTQSVLDQIRDAQLMLCDGETARNYPAYAEARYGLTERNTARIEVDDLLQ